MLKFRNGLQMIRPHAEFVFALVVDIPVAWNASVVKSATQAMRSQVDRFPIDSYAELTIPFNGRGSPIPTARPLAKVFCKISGYVPRKWNIQVDKSRHVVRAPSGSCRVSGWSPETAATKRTAF